MKKTRITITGMTCPACKMLIEDICGYFSDITNASVNVARNTLEITHKETLSLISLKQEIESSGDFSVRL